MLNSRIELKHRLLALIQVRFNIVWDEYSGETLISQGRGSQQVRPHVNLWQELEETQVTQIALHCHGAEMSKWVPRHWFPVSNHYNGMKWVSWGLFGIAGTPVFVLTQQKPFYLQGPLPAPLPLSEGRLLLGVLSHSTNSSNAWNKSNSSPRWN